MNDTVTRFSNRVANYAKYRPGYPPEVLDLFRREMGLTQDSIIADIGSGTGLSTYHCRTSSRTRLRRRKDLNDGRRRTNPQTHRMTQAFHWFDADKTRDEFRRILKPGGYVALIWNERQLDTTEFLREYEKLLLKYAKDYEKVRHENIDQQKLGFLSGRIPARASQTHRSSISRDFAGGCHHRICRPKTTHHFRPLKRTAKRF